MTTKYNLDAINGCMQKALDYKAKFGEAGDTFPQAGAGSTAYGELPSSAALSGAVDSLNTLMNEELNAAENRLNGVASALDAVVRTVDGNEQHQAMVFNGPRAGVV